MYGINNYEEKGSRQQFWSQFIYIFTSHSLGYTIYNGQFLNVSLFQLENQIFKIFILTVFIKYKQQC